MRKKLWLQFHLWTLGVVALLTIANVASALRPLPSAANTSADAGTINLVQTSPSNERAPASTNSAEADPAKVDLKLTQIGCEPSLRLRVADGVRQVRIRFEPCAMDSVDTVASVVNLTNGFEATVFNTAAKGATEAQPQAEGTFMMAAAPLPPVVKGKGSASVPRAPAAAPMAISTDYITLEPGRNEITIQREKRKQVLKIERK